MKKLISLVMACLMTMSIAAVVFAEETGDEDAAAPTQHMPVAVNPSPDKYTWYIQDYVGRNVAGFGYTSLGGDRLEQYGAGHLKFVFVTEDGSYLDIDNEDELKQYVVTGQSVSPNTELKLIFTKDSSGKEYSNLIDYQSIDSIDLTVRRLDGTTEHEPVKYKMIEIKPSPDKYTWYMRNYVGKNVASFGYTSIGNDRLEAYGQGHIKFNFVTKDGSFVDPTDIDTLKQYVVTGQDVPANTQINLTFMKDSKGKEYSNLIDNQSIDKITLYVEKLK